MEQEAHPNSWDALWAKPKDTFAASREAQIERVHADASVREGWKSDIEEVHRDNYERLIDTSVQRSRK